MVIIFNPVTRLESMVSLLPDGQVYVSAPVPPVAEISALPSVLFEQSVSSKMVELTTISWGSWTTNVSETTQPLSPVTE